MALTTGSKGDAVRELQENLKALGFYHATIDGDFGRRTREAVRVFQERFFVDGIVDKVTERAITEAVIAWAKREREILVPVPAGLKELEEKFGVIEYRNAGAGWIEITNDFAHKIERHEFPVVGAQCFHRDLLLVLERVLEDIRRKGLDEEIKQFGTWAPRHKMHDPSRNLSAHSWGIAVDVNWATNAVGTLGDLDSGIVESFERYGFEWGGRWRFKDPMHFQYVSNY
jgi:hypothetical protein